MGLQIDQWPWGRERILWGFDSAHKYTFKSLEPKKGRTGCLSLQYHHEKSETWVVFRGVAWALVVINGTVCTRVMRPGDVQNLETGVIHRIAGISDDVMVLEASTPDRHAADKSAPKDVVRLHCCLGRECAAPRDAAETQIVKRCVELTDEAMGLIEAGQIPPEHNATLMMSCGGHALL